MFKINFDHRNDGETHLFEDATVKIAFTNLLSIDQ